jgi:hypothetical protein
MKIFLLILVIFASSNGQDKDSIQFQDSIKSGRHSFLPNTSFLDNPSLSIPLSLNNRQQDFSTFLRQSLSAPAPPFSWSFNNKLSLESTWKQELADQNRYRTLRTILGSVQMGGVAYLTYLHIKKYGLK